ncbi:hypothetical protein [Mucilaginibacter sp.]|uniref:hypothetical protein n=1 Tax=Mucilaginibacter sp. TaxID=1882438 RepID=UPI00260D9537|nr:hypothetical protein [Mucilaginibacter sp.]MDB5032222.1 hypothetical protein [Mucilaginibacter sp.]
MEAEETITIRALYDGGLVSLRVVPKENYYQILLYDKQIAEIARNEIWEQITGDVLPGETIESIGLAIEDYYD